MKLQNVTVVILRRNAQGGLSVGRIVRNPEFPTKDGKPVIGPLCRRLLSGKQIAKRDGVSLNKGRDRVIENPLLCLADFPGQAPLAA
jgi:hypothetical protein